MTCQHRSGTVFYFFIFVDLITSCLNRLSLLSVSVAMLFYSIALFYANNAVAVDKPGIELIEEMPFRANFGNISQGNRVYKNTCAACHGFIGRGYVNRIESPSIVGLSAQEIVDSMIYYRDADAFGVELTGAALLMSRQVLALSNAEIHSLALYLSEIYGTDQSSGYE